VRLVRLTLVAAVAVPALAACGPPTPRGEDLKIDVVLATDGNKCVVRFQDAGLKDARRAIAWTNHAVIWRVVRNDCGERAKVDKKALGLKYLKLKSTGEPAPWFNQCGTLDRVPPTGNVEFSCHIPSSQAEGWKATGGWKSTDDVQVYEYVIDGDSVEPADPDIGIKRNG
jgi:hypothetical protein